MSEQQGLFDGQPAGSVDAIRDRALEQVARYADEVAPTFAASAYSYILGYLSANGPTSGERLSQACKDAGIRPHDDRAFGPVYMRLARSGAIEKVGTVRRERGHGTAGGNVWGLV